MQAFMEYLESLGVDFNKIIDGSVALFSMMSSNLPKELVILLLDNLPKSFNVSIDTESSLMLLNIT